jgi:hypothetical protein
MTNEPLEEADIDSQTPGVRVSCHTASCTIDGDAISTPCSFV